MFVSIVFMVYNKLILFDFHLFKKFFIINIIHSVLFETNL